MIFSTKLSWVVRDAVTGQVMTEPMDSEASASAEIKAAFPHFTTGRIMRMGFEIMPVKVTIEDRSLPHSATAYAAQARLAL